LDDAADHSGRTGGASITQTNQERRQAMTPMLKLTAKTLKATVVLDPADLAG
jgi:hypothetical protein